MIDEALELQNIVHAAQITDKWVAILGIGFHPDTRGEDYSSPALSAEMVAEYERDMKTLFAVSSDPYADAIEAWKRAGIIDA